YFTSTRRENEYDRFVKSYCSKTIIMKGSNLFSFIISLFLFATTSTGQTDQVYIKKVLPPEGAWQFITGIAQDLKGNMWFATPNGLFKYNGVSFKTYTNDPLD